MLEVFYAIILITLLIASWTFLIFYTKKVKDKNKKKSKILSIISISDVTSLSIIANTARLPVNEVRTLLEEMIEQATNKHKHEYKVLKKAYIDYTKNEIVLDPKARNTVMDKIGESVHAVLDKFVPNQDKVTDWNCSYCHALNKVDTYYCENCGAQKE